VYTVPVWLTQFERTAAETCCVPESDRIVSADSRLADATSMSTATQWKQPPIENYKRDPNWNEKQKHLKGAISAVGREAKDPLDEVHCRFLLR